MSSKIIILTLASLTTLFGGCQSTTNTLALSKNVRLYDLPEEEGGNVIHVMTKKTICHIEASKTSKMFKYYQVTCDGVSGWIMGGDQSE